jgi:hypothetical protein
MQEAIWLREVFGLRNQWRVDYIVMPFPCDMQLDSQLVSAWTSANYDAITITVIFMQTDVEGDVL